MTCAFSKELLALHVENDLPETDRRIVAKHLQECAECEMFLDRLSYRQSQLKMLRSEVVSQSTVNRMRRKVLSRIENSKQTLGWSVRIERSLWLGFRRHAFVFSTLTIAVVSATLLAQMRQPGGQPAVASTNPGVVFAENNALIRPAGYRNWIAIGSTIGSNLPEPHRPSNASSGSSSRFSQSVYMDPASFRAFSSTGRFPEGAVLILETTGRTDEAPLTLQASVKDSRFDGGWGFFNFTNTDGTTRDRTESVTGKSSCRTCHEERAKSDHVFTQFHPALKSAT